jgi:putative inorganic carbon (HCO3(-)) transporter
LARANKNQRAARRQAATRQATAKQASGASSSGAPAAGASAAAKVSPKARSRILPEATTEVMSLARRVAWWALLAMVFLVPIAMSNFTWLGIERPLTHDVFDIVKVFVLRVLSLVALAAWAWDMLRHGGRLRRTPVDWLILAFLVWVAITTVTSIHWPMAFFGKPRRYEGLLTFINYAVIYFLVLQFADSAARVRVLARALFFSSIVVAGYGVLQFIGWEPVTWAALPFETNRAFSTYGNPDLLGGFLIFSVTVALGLALAERNLVWRMAYWAGFGLNGLALIVAFTRGAWIGGAFGVVLVGVIAWRHRARMHRLDWIPAGISAALGVGIIWRSLSNPNDVMNFGKRLASIFEFRAGSGQTRTEIWQGAIAAIKEQPILGWGADTFRLVFPRFKPVEYVRDAGGTSVADNAHNYPLQLATGVGLPGMLMMYGVFVWAGVRSFRTVFGRSSDPQRIVRGAFWAAAAGYLMQLLVGLSLPGTTFLLWASLGVVLAPTAKVLDLRAPRWGTVVAALVLALAALGIGYQVLPMAADNAFLTARGDPAAARRAVKLNPFVGIYRAEVGLSNAVAMMDYLEAGARAQEAGQDTSQYAAAFRRSFIAAEAGLKDAIAFQPDEYDNYVALADIYNTAGGALDERFYDAAINAARKGLELSPYGTAIRLRLARAYLATGRTAEAVSELEYVVRIDPRDGDAALALASAYARQKRNEDALTVLRAFEARVPGQAGIADAIRRLEETGTAPAQ